MENNALLNLVVTASSKSTHLNVSHEPWLARLNNVPHGHTGSWSAASNQAGEWLQIDLGKETVVTKLATQGRPLVEQWVKAYKILFSSDSAKWKEYKENDAVKVIEFGGRHNDYSVTYMCRYKIRIIINNGFCITAIYSELEWQ